MTYSIDRIESRFVVAIDDNGKRIELDRKSLPEEVREGDIIEEADGNFTVNKVETEKRRSNNAALVKMLLNKGKK